MLYHPTERFFTIFSVCFKFIVVTDHKPLVTLFAPDNRLPFSNDSSFDGEGRRCQ